MSVTEPTSPEDSSEDASAGALIRKVDRDTLKAAWAGRLAMLALGVLLIVVIARFVRRVDWALVWSALSQLTWWQPLLLFGLVLVRQVANGAPLMFNIPGTSLKQATVCDMAAATMGVIAPPPAESAIRIAMFRSWGTTMPLAVAGAVLNSFSFFLIRFTAPLLGFIVVLITGRALQVRWLDVISLLIATVLLAGLLLVVRSTGLARWVGHTGGRLVRRFRPTVDPEAWAEACGNFREGVAGRFGYGFPRSLLANLVMLILDVLICSCPCDSSDSPPSGSPAPTSSPRTCSRSR